MAGLLASWTQLVGVVMDRRPPAPMPVPVLVPDADPPDDLPPARVLDDAASDDGAGFGPAEGQCFMIEYRDSKGAMSRRRITVWSVTPGAGGAPCLLARCHERRADRSFRVDRIVSIITIHGEVVEDVPSFMAARLGVHVRSDAAGRASRWPAVLQTVRPFAQILAGLSLADGRKDEREIAAAARYCAGRVAQDGADLSPDEHTALERYISTLRPRSETMLRALDRVIEMPTQDHLKLLGAARDVMEADGTRHPEEVRFIAQLQRDLTGL